MVSCVCSLRGDINAEHSWTGTGALANPFSEHTQAGITNGLKTVLISLSSSSYFVAQPNKAEQITMFLNNCVCQTKKAQNIVKTRL